MKVETPEPISDETDEEWMTDFAKPVEEPVDEKTESATTFAIDSTEYQEAVSKPASQMTDSDKEVITNAWIVKREDTDIETTFNGEDVASFTEVEELVSITLKSGYSFEIDKMTRADNAKYERFIEVFSDIEPTAEIFVDDIEELPEELFAVMTAAEAAREFGLSQSTVRQAINRGQVPARKSGGTWLVLRSDAEKQWKK
jgi:excisionase family DNA binding protein